MIDGLPIRKALRLAVLAGGTLALSYYGLEGTGGTLAGLLVLIGAIAVGLFCAKVWPEPKPRSENQREA